ncbi:hypothetical protein [Nonomuraea rubra]|uniref:hypothetical protein n=1 Tax=Nonomuraea rubra TaxID=46180 RepID=UPI0031E84328
MAAAAPTARSPWCRLRERTTPSWPTAARRSRRAAALPGTRLCVGLSGALTGAAAVKAA